MMTNEYALNNYYEYEPHFFVRIVNSLPESENRYLNEFVMYKDRLYFGYFNEDIDHYVWKDVTNFPKGEIEILKNDSDFMLTRMSCSCGDPRHSVTSCIEYDNGAVILNVDSEFGWNRGCTYEKVYIPYTDNVFKKFVVDTFINIPCRVWERIKAATQILFTGHLYMSSDFIFRGKEQIDEYAIRLLMASHRAENKNNTTELDNTISTNKEK